MATPSISSKKKKKKAVVIYSLIALVSYSCLIKNSDTRSTVQPQSVNMLLQCLNAQNTTRYFKLVLLTTANLSELVLKLERS